jgi:hypothetical protein
MAKAEKPITDRGHYTICESILEIDVEKNVNELMSRGWKPLGNLLVVVKKDVENDQEYIHFIQAMIKA